MLKIAHIADVHWRSLQRHGEYRDSFSSLFEDLRKEKVDAILIAGDIVHSKVHGVTPELISSLTWWFRSMCEICDVYVTLGNHDGLILNKFREDAITPVIKALNIDNLHLFKDSGVYDSHIPNVKFCVLSCFDSNYDIVKPVAGCINIGTYHGSVKGSKTDSGWELPGEIDIDVLEQYDITMLGDIHKMQYLNERKSIAYCGSTIQQNYGESPDKGVLIWEIEDSENFTSRFLPVENKRPFITIRWNKDLESTINRNLIEGARYRVFADESMKDVEMTQIKSRLKKVFAAKEVVFKIGKVSVKNVDDVVDDGLDVIDYRDTHNMVNALKEYHVEEFSDETWKQVTDKVAYYLDSINLKEPRSRKRWNLLTLRFSNLFAYGDDNYINFQNRRGLSGIFGKNRAGKSSIIGAVLYTLFNGTDRGTLKNVHAINVRKKYAEGQATISLDNNFYLIKRKTDKHVSRKGEVYTTTHLNVYQVDDMGNIIQDLTGEQRRDTENTLRGMIGTLEDFLMSSVSAQGDVNGFVAMSSSARRRILNNFLDLDLFSAMYDSVRDDYQEIKGILRHRKIKDWKTLIGEKSDKIDHTQKLVENLIEEKEGIISEIKKIRSQSINVIDYTFDDLRKTKQNIDLCRREIESLESSIVKIEENRESLEEKMKKADGIINSFDLVKSEKSLQDLRDAKSSLDNMLQVEKHLREIIKQKKDSIKILKQVPCGDTFPNCKFIKRSHESSKTIEGDELALKEVKKSIHKTGKLIESLSEDNIEKKIKSYNLIKESRVALIREITSKQIQEENLSSKIEIKQREIEKSELEFNRIQAILNDNEESSSVAIEIKKLEKNVDNVDKSISNYNRTIAMLENTIATLLKEMKEHAEVCKKAEVFDIMIKGFSKSGIPAEVVKSNIPRLNRQISNVLHSVTGFTLEVEVVDDRVEIYINYGDSKRIIELGSGMEKMMSSLALRVSMLNISKLPRSNIFVVDEGFGSLDQQNIESCGIFLDSLKKWFSNILIISHVDVVKDMVDHIIEVGKNEKDSRVYQA